MDEAVNGYLKFIKKSDIDKNQNNIDIDINNKKDNKKSKKKRMVKALQFTLPAFKSKTGAKVCNGAGACAAYCYAAAGTYQYPLGTFKSEFSLMFSLSREFVPNLIKYLRELPKNVFYIFRIHDSGDFYSPKYFKKWVFIAKRFPGIIFYGYTKQPAYLSMETPPNFKFTQSFGGRNDRILEKLLKIKSKFSKEGVYTDRERKIIIRYLNLNSNNKRKLTLEDWDEENFKRILSKLTISKVFTSDEEYEAERKANPGITWIKVVDDDIAALDVGIGPNPPIGIALFVHGQNSAKLKPKLK
jgi:ferredoxin